MPLNSIPPTTTVENLAVKRSAAREQCWTDVAFWGGVIPGNQVRNFRSFSMAEIN
jgi:allantoinase